MRKCSYGILKFDEKQNYAHTSPAPRNINLCSDNFILLTCRLAKMPATQTAAVPTKRVKMRFKML